jgi:hypothetical protein
MASSNMDWICCQCTHKNEGSSEPGPCHFCQTPHPKRRWWFLSPLPRQRQSLCAFASKHAAPPVLSLRCLLSLCALANQHATPVLSLICPIQMRRRMWHPPRRWQRLRAFASQHRATPVPSLTCMLQMQRSWL